MRVHLESVDNLANQGDKVLFDISLYKNKNNAEYLVISPQGIKETGTHDNNDHSLHRWLTVNGGTFANNLYAGAAVKAGAATGVVHTAGDIAVELNDGTAKKNAFCLYGGGYATGTTANKVYTAENVDIGIAGGDGCGLVFRKGEILYKVSEDKLVDALMDEIEKL